MNLIINKKSEPMQNGVRFLSNILDQNGAPCIGRGMGYPGDQHCVRLTYIPAPGERVVLNPELTSKITSIETENPLVFLITTPVHSILYIISDSRLYSVGFGYSHDAPEEPIEDLIVSGEMVRKVRGRVKEVDPNEDFDADTALADKIRPRIGAIIRKIPAIEPHLRDLADPLEGGLYTVDHLMPRENQTAQISWVGYFTNEMAERIQTVLDSTLRIEGNVIFRDNKYHSVHNRYSLQIVEQPYLRYAGLKDFNPFQIDDIKSHNCLTWAEHILGISLNCGFAKDPALCKEVTQEELYRLINAIRGQPNVNGERETQTEVIAGIQHRLLEREHPLSSAYRSTMHYFKKTRNSTGKGGNRLRKKKKRMTRKRRR
jgi:hypothetical protein